MQMMMITMKSLPMMRKENIAIIKLDDEEGTNNASLQPGNMNNTSGDEDLNTSGHEDLNQNIEVGFYLGMFVLLCAVTLPPSLTVIGHILRSSKRWTGVNLVVGWSRIVSLAGLVLPFSLVFPELGVHCISSHLIIPLLLLHEKVSLTTIALLRYLYIFYHKLLASWPTPAVVSGVLGFAVLLLVLPLMTLSRELPPLLHVCANIAFVESPTHTFLFLFMVVWFSTLLADIFSYIRIINYMRLASVRIDVVPDTVQERKKVVNIVTGSSSLLIWLVSVVSMLPTLALLYQSPWNMPDSQHIVTAHYQILSVFVINCVVPVMYIGSSLQLRALIDFLRNRIEQITSNWLGVGGEEPRAAVYTVPHSSQANQSEDML